jgi:Na+-translocating ferredoxin:NAD+ oxidoreductase RnfD subunit
MLVAVIVTTVAYGGNISDQFNISWLGFGIGFVIFPLLLLAVTEMIGRMIQSYQ